MFGVPLMYSSAFLMQVFGFDNLIKFIKQRLVFNEGKGVRSSNYLVYEVMRKTV
jgi:hypothetical protein